MKNKIKSFFTKKNIVFVVLIIILIIISLFFVLRKNMDKVIIKDHDLYQYLNGIKIEYTGTIEIDKKTEDITKLNFKDVSIDLDTTPIYFKDSSKTLFPKNMGVMFPTQGTQYKINYHSTIYRELEDIYVKDGSMKRILSDAIIYDGADIYYLVDETKITFLENEIILKPMSYIIVDTFNQMVQVYDYDKDNFSVYENVNDEVIISTDKYKVNASFDLMYYNDKSRLFIKKIDMLSNLKSE